MYGVIDFDIVIGNPPYGAKIKDRSFIRQLYSETSFGTTESYKYFTHRYINILNNRGILCYITSDSFLEKENFLDLRNLIIENSKVAAFLKLGDDIFKNVNLPTAISILEIDEQSKSKVISVDVSEIPIDKKIAYVEDQGFSEVKYNEDSLKRFIEKSNSITIKNAFKLIDKYDQVMGVKVYQVGKGRPRQTNYEIENDIFISDVQKNKDWLKFIDSGIKRYDYNGSSKYIHYGEWLAEPREIKYFKNPKIVLREVVNPSPFATLVKEPAIIKNTNAVIIQKDKNYSLSYLLAILNSKVFNYYIKKESPKSKNKLFPSITSRLLKEFPVAICNVEKQKSFEIITSYILALNKLGQKSQVNDFVPNSHIVQSFEEVIDALVYELYFEEDFKKAGIEFMKYAQRDFKSIEGKDEKEAIVIIENAYQALREKDNEIRNNLKLMDIKLADLIMPIKTAK